MKSATGFIIELSLIVQPFYQSSPFMVLGNMRIISSVEKLIQLDEK